MAVGSPPNFVLNIVELQNVVTSASGLTPVTSLQNAVANIQQMVNYDQKLIRANTFSKYDTSPIQFTDSVNFASGTTLSVNGVTVGGSGSSGSATGTLSTVTSVGYGANAVGFATAAGSLAAPAITFQVQGDVSGTAPVTPMYLTVGGALVLGGGATGVPAIGRVLTCVDASGTAEWQDPGFVSDARWKENILPIRGAMSILDQMQGVRFRWVEGGEDIGVIAQELMHLLPEAIIEGVDGRPHRVQYHKIIPVLVEAVKELKGRVEELERRLAGGGTDAAPACGALGEGTSI